jgi:hypothetical protein
MNPKLIFNFKTSNDAEFSTELTNVMECFNKINTTNEFHSFLHWYQKQLDNGKFKYMGKIEIKKEKE